MKPETIVVLFLFVGMALAALDGAWQGGASGAGEYVLLFWGVCLLLLFLVMPLAYLYEVARELAGAPRAEGASSAHDLGRVLRFAIVIALAGGLVCKYGVGGDAFAYWLRGCAGYAAILLLGFAVMLLIARARRERPS